MQLVKSLTQNIALGSTSSLTIVIENTENYRLIENALWVQIYKFEKKFSRFLHTSELSLINRLAGKKTPISGEMYDLLNECKKYYYLTEKMFNPFILPALEGVGYTKSALKNYDQETPSYKDRNVYEFSEILLSTESVTIPPDSALDLGGIGKGYLADKIVHSAKQLGVLGCCVSLGGDVAGFGHDEYGRDWHIAVQKAKTPDQTLDIEFIPGTKKSFHIATSGVITRRFDKRHHIINSSTRDSAKTDVLLSTVTAASTTLADILASYSVAIGSTDSLTELPKIGSKSMIIQTSSQVIKQGLGWTISRKEVYA